MPLLPLTLEPSQTLTNIKAAVWHPLSAQLGAISETAAYIVDAKTNKVLHTLTYNYSVDKV